MSIINSHRAPPAACAKVCAFQVSPAFIPSLTRDYTRLTRAHSKPCANTDSHAGDLLLSTVGLILSSRWCSEVCDEAVSQRAVRPVKQAHSNALFPSRSPALCKRSPTCSYNRIYNSGRISTSNKQRGPRAHFLPNELLRDWISPALTGCTASWALPQD